LPSLQNNRPDERYIIAYNDKVNYEILQGMCGMYTYKDLENLTGLSITWLRQWNHMGIINGDSSGRPTVFDMTDAWRAAWIAMLMRAHFPLNEANELFDEALGRARKDPGVVMLLTHEGPKFLSGETHFKRLWALVREEGAVFHVISVGMFFQKVQEELETMRKVRNFRKSVGMSDPVSERESLTSVN
jgi:hypothetical protein